MASLTLVALLVGSVIVIILSCISRSKSSIRNGIVYAGHTIPQPPGRWPIIGHLPLLAGDSPAYRALGALAGKWGPIFALQLGTKRTVVISGMEAAKECFTTNDIVLASRSTSSLGKYTGHDFAMFGFAPYGPYWRSVRKVAVLELLSSAKIGHFRTLRACELKEFIKELYSKCMHDSSDGAVNMGEWFTNLVTNITLRMVTNKRYAYIRRDQNDEGERVRRAITKFSHAAGLLVLSDMVPVPLLEWLEIQGPINKMKKATMELDSIVKGWIDEHQEKIAVDEVQNCYDGDFIGALLSHVEKGNLKFDQFTNETIILAAVEATLFAGNDTTSTTLTWALSLLINHAPILKRAQDELDRVVGTSRWAEEPDIPKLIYLQAIIKETLRLYPPAPLGIPHQSTQGCSILGYHVQEGTQVIINLWKLHRDPRFWADPDKFQPERFVSGPLATVDIGVGRCFEYMPFGSGRRICPGSKTALQILYLTFARLIQGFTLSNPNDKPVDLTEGPGTFLTKALPLELVLRPRLPHKMYL